MHRIIFDTETTGLIKPNVMGIENQPYITEIYLVKVDEDFNLIDEFGTYIKPPIPIPEFLQKKIGITDAMVAKAPTFAEVYDKLADFFLGAEELVAHNLAFDRSMLANELVRIEKVLKFPWPKKHTCTVEKSLSIQQRRITLTNLHKEAFGKEFADAHSAKADVYALTRCFHWLHENGYCDD